jgi:DNA-binding NtrC family response regulator/energy-coupling factor transporter ATP-binding protein EcfA2
MASRRARSEPDPPLLAGRYRYERELARGATGRVLAVTDRGEIPRVAKVLGAEAGAHAQWELDALLRVRSPHLVEAIELLRAHEPLGAPFSVPRGAWILVEGRASGEPSAAVIAALEDDDRRGARVASATIGVLRALSALHAQGLSHGDLKPDNVLLEGEHATLVDLGAAAPFGRSTTLSGTLAFMAPEAREGERSPATDLYALGATVVAWATGAPPAPGELPALPSWLPEPLSALTKALLADRIAERPRDAEAALRALSGGSFGSAMGPRALPTRPALVGMDVAIERLLTTLDARGWALVVGPSGSGRSRVIEEVARAVQRREGRAGREAPTYLRTDRWPDSPTAPTFVHLEGAIDREVAVGRARRILSDGRIAGLTHRVVLEMSDADGPEPGEVVRVPPLETDEARALLASLLGEAPGALALRAAMDASGGLAGRLVRGVGSLSEMELDPRRPESWRLVASAPSGSQPTRAAQRIIVLAQTLGGEIELSSPPRDPTFAEGARWLLREGMASIDAAGALVLRTQARATATDAASAAERQRALRDAASLPLAGLSRAVLDAHGAAHEAADRAVLSLARSLRERAQPEQAVERLSRYLDAVPPQPGASRASLRLALADALRASGEIAAAVACLAADPRCAELAPARLLRAELARLARQEDLTLELAGAITHDPEVGAEARTLVARAVLARDSTRARALARAVLDAPSASAVTRAHEVIALAAMLERHTAELLDHARAGLALSHRVEPLPRRRAIEARLTSLEACGLALEGHLDRARARHAESAALARLAGDRLLEATFGVNDGLAALEHGDLGTALTALERGAHLLHRLDRERELGRVLTNLANAYGLAGDDARARMLIEEAERALEGKGDADAEDLAAIVKSELLVHRGKLRAACGTLESVGGVTSSVRSIVRARLASVLATCGDVTRAEEVLASIRDEDDPRADTEHALATARVALTGRELERARAALARAREHCARERVGFELRARALALEVELEEASARRADARAALGRLRAVLEPALRSLGAEAQSRFRQIPGHRRALAEGLVGAREHGADAERALEALAVLAGEPRVDRLDDRLAEIALELAAAERAFVVEWTEEGLAVRGRAGAARADTRAMPSSALTLRALRERVVLSTDATHEQDASSSVHALALRSVLALELAARPAGAGPRVLVVDDPLRPAAFDARVVETLRAVTDIAGPLIAARLDSRRARQRERRAERREAELEAEARRWREATETEWRAGADPFATFAHAEPATAKGIDEARRLAASELPILIVGESGVGKSLLARAIHRASARRHETYLAVRGGELASSLADAMIFGHVRGAFTGAEGSRQGIFELAHRGTLLLEGIEDIPLEAQAKLLRILVDGAVRPLGANRLRRADVRVLATTRLPPSELLANGSLRHDFYFRVAGAVLGIPPLRERPLDVDAVVARVLARSGRHVELSARARDALHARRWPGNVRELEHVLTEALLRVSGRTLDLAALRPEPAQAGAKPEPASLHEQRGALTREVVLATLEAHDGNRTHAARALGVSRYGLQKILRRLADRAPAPHADERERK